MSTYQETVERLRVSGANQDEIDAWTRSEVEKLKVSGATDTDIQDWLGVVTDDDPEVVEPIRSYWQRVSDSFKSSGDFYSKAIDNVQGKSVEEISEMRDEAIDSFQYSMVGDEAEFGKYFERGIGKSTANLARVYHFGDDKDIQKVVDAMSPEPRDTGHLERFVEGITTIGSDLPIYIAGGAATTAATGGNPYAGAFGAGFINSSLKTTYMTALQQGKVDNAGDWWRIFIKEGMKQGAKDGFIMAGAYGAPRLLGITSRGGIYATEAVAYEGLAAAVNQKLPTKDEWIQTFLIGATLGGVDAGTNLQAMTLERSKKVNKSPAEIVEDVINDGTMIEDVLSKNIKNFRKEPRPDEILPDTFENDATVAEAATPPVEPEAPTQVEDAPVVDVPEPEVAAPKETSMQRKFRETEASDAVNEITAKVVVDAPTDKGSFMKDFKNQFVTTFLDKLHPIHVEVERARKAGVDVGLVSPYQSARIQAGMENRADFFLSNGTLDFKTLQRNGKSLFEVVAPIKNEKDYKNAIAYLIAKRAIEKADQGMDTGFPIESARQVVKELDGQFGVMQKEIVDYQNRIVDYMVDSGIIAKKDADSMKEANQDYVPFFRVLDPSVKDKNAAFGKAVFNPYKKMRGGEQPIFNPLESIVNNTMHHVVIAERNKSFVDFIEMVEKAPELFPDVQKAEAAMKITNVKASEMQKAFDSPISPEFADGISVFRREHGIVSDTQIAIFRNGKKEIWEVGKDLQEAFRGTNRYQAGLIVKMASVPSRVLRAGSTLAPDFMLRNFNRDTVNSAIVSDRNFIPFLHSGQGFWHVLKQDNVYQEWAKSGAMQSSIQSLDRTYFQKDVKKFLTAGKVRNQISNPLELLRVMAEVTENTTRVGNFQRSMTSLKRQKQREGKEWTDRDILEASGYESRDLMDFARIGSKIQAVNMMSAFFNARLQGYAKIYDAFKRKPAQTMLKVTTYITLPSIVLWWLNHDDERYKQLPQWEKDLFWHIITPEIGIGDELYKDDNDYTIYRIPKPFELGLLFGTVPERALTWGKSWLEGKNDGSADAYMDSISDFVTTNLSGLAPIPDVAKPYIESKYNESLFTNLPIIPYGTENMLPRYQYNEYTSETAKLIGATMDEITGGRMGSPAKIDNVVQNWTGTLGRYAIQVADYGLRQADVVEEVPPATRLEDLPVIKAFLSRNPKGSSEYISRFYKKTRKMDGLFATLDKLEKEGNFAEIGRLARNADFDLIALKGAKEAMSNIRKLIRMTYINNDISAEDKRQLIDELYQTQIDIAKNALDTYLSLGEE